MAMAIRIGLFGFGKTGRVVAGEILQDAACSLEWVARRSRTEAGEFASRLLGFKKDEGRIIPIEDIDDGKFFAANPVDVIIDFAGSAAVATYATADRCGAKVISAISKYTPEDLVMLEELGHRTAVLYSPNITLGINFLIVISKVLHAIAPDADIEIVEEHFRAKKEVSGTALKIAEQLGLDKQSHVNSIRVGGIVGRH
jgi:4-hydroxy-tetrahydrodipicolinate reductase